MAATTIEDLFRRHWPLVLGYLIRQTRDPHLAEEIAQETFVRATRAFLGWSGGTPAAWLLAIARNTLIDHARKHGRTVLVAEMPSGELRPVAGDERVRDALAQMPPRPR
jgi:RNA polymerase sigma-70 factor (ECF subfamily)